MERVRFSFEATFSPSQNAALAAKYLTSGEMAQGKEIEIALSCLFAPLGAASEGASANKVKSLIETSRIQFETYMSLALCRLENHSDISTDESCPTQEKSDDLLEDEEDDLLEDEEDDLLEDEEKEVRTRFNLDNKEKEVGTILNLDDEEF